MDREELKNEFKEAIKNGKVQSAYRSIIATSAYPEWLEDKVISLETFKKADDDCIADCLKKIKELIDLECSAIKMLEGKDKKIKELEGENKALNLLVDEHISLKEFTEQDNLKLTNKIRKFVEKENLKLTKKMKKAENG